ncbi:tyrosine-type recombinase/integrase [Brevibacterium aurantiacum]|uniref:tyrosine-type recombinase/integrase n=1 Tax=Brevibacterium aurantiacum TaxID=273384 RepID=UPI00186835E7|nr:tyrosine-type recombinase/integrase [Brevibacterium aurantiacum]MDN5877884.1 tyrosine-type recombinase/integrase [Brevibacterium sp.]MDN5910881.1 tyrosine-type recombinase/integrase [Brevibacterium sp.]
MKTPKDNDVTNAWWTGLGIRPRRNGGALEPLLTELIDWLSDQGYALTTTHNIVRAALRLGEWMNRDHITITDLEPGAIAALIRADNAAHPSHRVANESTAAVQLFLRTTQRLSSAQEPEPCGGAQTFLAQWCTELRTNGYGHSWIEKARNWAGGFLDLIEDDHGGLDWNLADAELINDYILDFSRHYSSSAVQCLTALLRDLLSWAAINGHAPDDKSGLVLSVHRSPARLPKGLPADQIVTLTHSIDTNTPMGKRDLAIIVMLTRLGVRVGEVAHLTLDDIDWHQASLRMVGKNERVLVLPMPTDVGDTLVEYLRVRHAQQDERHVFIRSLAPLTAMTRAAISNVVTARAKSAGLNGVYAHRLRHTLAAGILAGGGDLESIRQLLGHADSAQSLSYARLDVEPLRALTPVWGQLP